METDHPIILSGFYPRISNDINDRFNFRIDFDRERARKFKHITIPQDSKDRIQRIAQEEILKQLGMNYSSPFIFYKDSLLISQINVATDGRWLATSFSDIDELDRDSHKKCMAYTSHNIDTPIQAYACLSCFTKWLEFTTIW